MSSSTEPICVPTNVAVERKVPISKARATRDYNSKVASDGVEKKMLQFLVLFVLIFQSTSDIAGADCPRIVSRSEWGAKPPKSVEPATLPFSKVFIHHTETPSCTTEATCASRVRQIQSYHQVTRGWADIGYNFLVGQDGNAYEGRGWNNKGAHAKKYNSKALGIAVIGSFQDSMPNSAALNAVKELIACGISKGKVSGSYALHGHRDGCSTDCPGSAFYNLIKSWPRFGGKLPGTC